MAERRSTGLLESYLKCHMCSETFSDPVSLSCNHNFCFECLQNDWQDRTSRNCPVCGSSCMNFPSVNFELKVLSDSFAGRLMESEGEEDEGAARAAACRKHKDATKMLCEDKQRIMCPLCDASPHRGHVVLPVEEAARGLKEQLKVNLTHPGRVLQAAPLSGEGGEVPAGGAPGGGAEEEHRGWGSGAAAGAHLVTVRLHRRRGFSCRRAACPSSGPTRRAVPQPRTSAPSRTHSSSRGRYWIRLSTWATWPSRCGGR